MFLMFLAKTFWYKSIESVISVSFNSYLSFFILSTTLFGTSYFDDPTSLEKVSDHGRRLSMSSWPVFPSCVRGHRRCISQNRPGFLWPSWGSRQPWLPFLNSWKGRTGSSPTQGRAGIWAVRCIRLRRLPFTTESTSGLIWSDCSRSFPIRKRKASSIRTVFRGRTRFRTRSGKERKAVRNKGETASDTDIIRLRRRFCYTSWFFTLAVFSRDLQKFTPPLDKMPIKGDTVIGNDVWIG